VPLILWLHGGPYLAWCPHLAILPQVWAARGYAVLMVNPRGSLGYGEAFIDELQHDFPGPDDLQLLDMVEHVVARGGIDPHRLHVAGESGGGVMTSGDMDVTESGFCSLLDINCKNSRIFVNFVFFVRLPCNVLVGSFSLIFRSVSH
jgi:carboxylesterase type B